MSFQPSDSKSLIPSWCRFAGRRAAVVLVPCAMLAMTGCDGDKSSDEESSAPAATTSSAKASASASASASAAPAAPPALELFSGAPAFEGKTKAYTFMGVRYDMPLTWREWNDKPEKLIATFNNPPNTVKGKLWLAFVKDTASWATAEAMTKTEEESRTAEVTQGGKKTGTLKVPSACEDAAFKATNVHHTKQTWSGPPKAATFGATKRPGAVMEGKDPKGKWTFYCVRAALTDSIGLVGAVAYRVDKKGHEKNGAALRAVLKSFRGEGKE